MTRRLKIDWEVAAILAGQYGSSMPRRRHGGVSGAIGLLALAALAGACSMCHFARAATIFWNGTAGNDLWSSTANWSGGSVPGASDVAWFDDFSDPSLTPVVDLNGDRTVQSITIRSPRPFTINNNTLSLTTGDIDVNEDGVPIHTINSNVQLQANGLWTISPSSTLVVAGDVTESGGSRSLTKAGFGVLVLGGNNSYTGGTFINEGTLRMGPISDSIPDLAPVTIAAGATLDLDIQPEAVGTLLGGGSILMNGGGANLIFGADNGSGTFSGLIVGSGTINKQGTGVQTLTGNSSYSGTTFITDGKLLVSSASSLGNSQLVTFLGAGRFGATSNINFNNHQFLANGANSSRFEPNAGVFMNLLGGAGITGTGGLVKTGSGTLNLQTNNTYSGTTEVQQGFLDVSGSSERLPDSTAVNVASGAQFRFFLGAATETIGSLSGSGAVVFGNSNAGGTNLRVGAANVGSTFSGNIRQEFGGTGRLTKVGTATLTLTGTNTYTGGTVVDGGSLKVNTDSLPAAGGVVNNSNLNFDQAFYGVYEGIISGPGVLNKEGGGTLVLTRDNTYQGGTVIEEGTLEIFSNDNLGDDSAIVFLFGGTLRINTGGTVFFPGARRFATHTDSNANFEVTPGTVAFILGGVAGDGSLVKSGDGQLTLLSVIGQHVPSTYTGDTIVNAGILTVERGSFSIPTELIPDQSAVILNGSGRLTLFGGDFLEGGGYTETIGSLTGGSSAEVAFAASSGNHLRVGANNQSTTFAGEIFDEVSPIGSGKLTKIGFGTLTLTGHNTYSEGTVIEAGILDVNTNSLPAAGGVALASVDTATPVLRFSQQSAGTYDGVISGDGTVIIANSSTLTLTQENTWTGRTLLESGVLAIRHDSNLGAAATAVEFQGGTLQVESGSVAMLDAARDLVAANDVMIDAPFNARLRVDGQIRGNGGLIKTGPGTLNVRGNNTYSGTTDIQGGFLDVNGSSERLPDSTAVSVASGGQLGFYVGAETETIGSLAGSGRVAFGNTDAGGTNLRVGAANVETTFSGNITQVFGGTGKLTKVGSATLTLTGINSYTGGTFVEAGRLKVDTASLPSASGVVNIAVLEFDQGFDGNYSGEISGTGSVVKSGTGVLTLNQLNSNSYGGGTRIQDGVLAVSFDGQLGAVSGPITFAGGELRITGQPTSHPAQ